MGKTDSGMECYYTSVKTFSLKWLKDVGIEVPKSIETRSKCSIYTDKGRG